MKMKNVLVVLLSFVPAGLYCSVKESFDWTVADEAFVSKDPGWVVYSSANLINKTDSNLSVFKVKNLKIPIEFKGRSYNNEAEWFRLEGYSYKNTGSSLREDSYRYYLKPMQASFIQPTFYYFLDGRFDSGYFITKTNPLLDKQRSGVLEGNFEGIFVYAGPDGKVRLKNNFVMHIKLYKSSSQYYPDTYLSSFKEQPGKEDPDDIFSGNEDLNIFVSQDPVSGKLLGSFVEKR